MRYAKLEKQKNAKWNRFIDDDSIVIGSFDNDTLVGYIALTKLDEKSARLRDIYVKEDYRGQWIASDLVLYVRTKLQSAGIKYIYATIKNTADENKMIRFLDAQRFVPFHENKEFRYDLPKLLSGDSMKAFIEKYDSSNGCVSVKDATDGRFRRFANKLKDNGQNIFDINFNPHLSCFYKNDDGEYVGCILIEQNGNEIFWRFMYLKNNSKVDNYGVAVFAMTAKVMQRLAKIESQPDELVVSIADENQEGLITYMFDKPKSSDSVWEWKYDF